MCTKVSGTNIYQNFYTSCFLWGMVKLKKKCITDFKISTCPASKITCQGDRTSEMLYAAVVLIVI